MTQSPPLLQPKASNVREAILDQPGPAIPPADKRGMSKASHDQPRLVWGGLLHSNR